MEKKTNVKKYEELSHTSWKSLKFKKVNSNVTWLFDRVHILTSMPYQMRTRKKLKIIQGNFVEIWSISNDWFFTLVPRTINDYND